MRSTISLDDENGGVRLTLNAERTGGVSYRVAAADGSEGSTKT